MTENEQIGIGTRVYKPLDTEEKYQLYASCAVFANETKCAFEDKGDYYELTELPPPNTDDVKTNKFSELETKFLDWYESGATVTSSLGFVADSDSRAIMDISGLVTSLEAQPAETRSTVAFMDAENQSHALTLDQLKTLQLEVIQNGQAAYAQKWALRTQIESAESVEALQAIEITFTGLDFSASA